MTQPPPGSMVYWRMQSLTRNADQLRDNEWRFGYVTYLSDPDLIRMGRWNGDCWGGSIVSSSEIVTRPYR